MKQTYRFLAIFLVLTLLCGITAVAAPADNFPFRSIEDLGTTRGQMVTALWLAAGSPEPESLESPFTDLTESDSYFKAALWCCEQKLTYGVSSERFFGEGALSRAAAAVYLQRYAGYCGMNTQPTITEVPYEDCSESIWYWEAVLWCYENGYAADGGEIYFYPGRNNVCGHLFTVVGSREPTCTEPGCENGEMCTLCGTPFSEEGVIPPLGHSPEVLETVEPTCDEEGYDLLRCTVCDECYRDNFVPPLGHLWDNGFVYTMPTEIQCGYRCHTCYRCDSQGFSEIPTDSPLTYTRFRDLDSESYYYEPVLWAVQFGITSGMDATHFGPGKACTRAQVVTFLWRAVGCPEPEGTTCGFADISSGAYYYKALLWAAENGIVKGVSETRFAPDSTVTRGQFVTFLWRLFGEPEPMGANGFTDVSVGQYYYNAVLWAAEWGITTGMDNSHFAPEGKCTRGQVVTFLYRV